MKKKLIAAGAVAITAAMLTACQSATKPAHGNTPSGICRSDAATALTGKDRLTDEQAKEATGATIVRQISPGQGVTMDYRQERVTIETDPKTGKIFRAYCG